MTDAVRERFTGLDRLFLDALVAEEYDAAAGLAVLGGLRIKRAQANHALAEGYER
jgi:hypothetical protein